MPDSFENVLVTQRVPEDQLQRLEKAFGHVHYFPFPSEVPPNVQTIVDCYFVGAAGIPPSIKALTDLHKLRFVQVASTGIEKVLRSDAIASIDPAIIQDIHLSNAAGGYVLCIPNFILNYITGLLGLIPSQIYLQRSQKRWVGGEGVMQDVGFKGDYAAKSILGKTIGFLGYGSIARETARLCSVFPKIEIIAANSDGKRKSDDGYVIEGTGDADASIPSEMYSTSDPASLEAFLRKCDILVASLPATKRTIGLLDAEKLALLKPRGLFINVGRGSIIKSEHILAALDRPDGLYGAAIDVTEPEPLEDNHPLWSHPRLIITPHLSGEPENEFATSLDIFFTNLERLGKGQDVCNKASFAHGY